MLSFVARIPTSMTSPVTFQPTNKTRQVCVKPITTQTELNLALGVRRRVFVDEMGIPATEEFDAFDSWPVPHGITHFLVTVDQQAIATCRINCVHTQCAKLERMAVDRLTRRKGVGRALLRHIERSDIVEHSLGAFYCYAMKDKELFYRDCGWIVEEGHDSLEDAGIPHVAMVLRRRPRGSPVVDSFTMSHVMVRTWDISRARRFYSLLGYQDVTRFKTNGLKAVWIRSPYIDQTIELIEVKDLVKDRSEPNQRASLSSLSPGLGHISMDVSRACTDLNKFLLTVQKESMDRFQTKLRLLEPPRQIMLGSTITEIAFMTDADGTVLEMLRLIKKLDDKVEYDAEW